MFYQNYCIITNKIGFYAKEPYSPLKPHVAIIGLAWGACWVRYVLMALLCWLFRVLWRRRQLRLLRRRWGVRPRGLHRLPVAEMESLRFYISAELSGCNKMSQDSVLCGYSNFVINYFWTFCNDIHFAVLSTLILGLTWLHRGSGSKIPVLTWCIFYTYYMIYYYKWTWSSSLSEKESHQIPLLNY